LAIGNQQVARREKEKSQNGQKRAIRWRNRDGIAPFGCSEEWIYDLQPLWKILVQNRLRSAKGISSLFSTIIFRSGEKL
jgi:hypothetical protein